MAIANFFGKAALAATQLLKGIDPTDFKDLLEAHTVGVFFDDDAAMSSEGQTTLELCINLLARLYPRLAIVATGASAEAFVTQLINIARSINPVIDVENDLVNVTACLVVGSTVATVNAPTVYIGSDAWIVRLSQDTPVGSCDTRIPFGAGAAACFGVANIFRLLFRTYLPAGDPDRHFALSLLDLTLEAEHLTNPKSLVVDIGETHLVGLGAIGNGAVWALSRTPTLTGILHLIDAETVDLGNLQRYVLMLQEHKEVSKVAAVADVLKQTSLDVRPHNQRWGDYLRERNDWRLARVAVAVDSTRDRIAIQAALPQWIVNGWTQASDLGISRHTFLGEQACLACLYLPSIETLHEDRLIAQAIGLPEAYMEVRAWLYANAPVERSLLERIANALHLPVESLIQFEGKSLRTFYSEAICGGVVLTLGGHIGQEAGTEVPMAFQSALAGILLAAEIIADAGHLRYTPPMTTTRINLLRPLTTYLSYPVAKHASGRCICQDHAYIAAYQAKY
jgi:hypothetical protein